MKMQRKHIQIIIVLIISSFDLYSQEYEMYKTFYGHADEITALNFRDEDNLLVSGSNNGEIIIRNLSNNDTLFIKAHTAKVSDLNFANKNNWLVSAGYEGTIKVWDITTGNLKFTFTNPAIPAYGQAPNRINGNEPTFAVFNSDDKFLYFGGYNGKVILANLQQNTTEVIYEDKSGGITSGLVHNNNLIFAATKNIYFFDLATKNITKTLKKSENKQDYVCEIAIIPQMENKIAYWAYNGSVNIFNYATGRFENEIKATIKTGTSNIAFSWDGLFMITGNDNDKVKIWNTTTNQSIQILKGHRAEVTNFALSSDAYYIVTGSKDKTVKVWKKKIIEEDLTHVPDSLNNRPVEMDETETVRVKSKNIEFLVWDNQRPDGDIISVNLNGKWILENFTLKTQKHSIEVELNRGKNYVILFAHNEGTEPPNTASIAIKDGTVEKLLTLKSTLKTNAALNIVYEP